MNHHNSKTRQLTMKSALKQVLNKILLSLIEAINSKSTAQVKELINQDVERFKTQSFNGDDLVIITIDMSQMTVNQRRYYQTRLQLALSDMRANGLKTRFLVIPTCGDSKVSSLEKIGDKKLQELGLARLH